MNELMIRTSLAGFFLFCFLTTVALPLSHAADKAVSFDGYGIIDSIDAKKVVIDDHGYKFADGARFYSKNNQPLGSGYFGEGAKVRFRLNSDNEIIAIWKYDPPKE